MKLYVVEGSGANLLGRNWLNMIELDWSTVLYTANALHIEHYNTVGRVPPEAKDELNDILVKYKSIFEDTIGTMKGYKAKINIKDNAIPRFAKARNVPFALEYAMNNELERLEREYVLKSISYSECASPIVIIPKPDGQVRICGDLNEQ